MALLSAHRMFVILVMWLHLTSEPGWEEPHQSFYTDREFHGIYEPSQCYMWCFSMVPTVGVQQAFPALAIITKECSVGGKGHLGVKW